ncbi:hypothetical protein SCLCIDRAFT_26619 [Scleroderma citrinum Foug A]|uniref:Uncharacterized protein n=1 Tax=Scleroderma citrinum Foug A TaxID=1036808 RepID=A0A0C3A6J4_9AGAM|nr:hypothetical protein SCLCIDRAFT_26619 [Scleroderma citrinum Foug A]
MSSGNNTDSSNNGNSANKIDWQGLKRVAEEEARKLAKEEAKKKAKEDAQKRAKFQAWWKANLERKAREKAEAMAAAEVMRAQIAQKVGQGEKPKPKPKQCRAASQHVPDEEKMKVKCYFKVSTVTMKRSASSEKCKESEMLVTMVTTSLTKEIKEALGGFSVAGPLTWPDPVTQVLDRQLGEVIVAINCNTRELVWLKGKMDGAQPEETEEEEEKLDDMSDADAESEDMDE